MMPAIFVTHRFLACVHSAFYKAIFANLFFCISLVAPAQTFPAGFSQVLVATGITKPTAMAFALDGRLFVAQQTGALRIIKNGVLLAQPFLTLSVNASGERGLLGIAFDPAFNSNHYIYLYYTLASAANNRISRFTANGDVVVPGSEVVLLDLDPLSTATNHNGGTMAFGKDGKLYVGVGENAAPSQAQNLDTYHGKILRVNSNGSAPADNPFTTGSAQRQRVWAYGMRNPYTLTIQPESGRIFVNDVGQNTWEEINDCTIGGRNYGWPAAEGASSNNAYVNPVYAYQHGSGSGLGCAITGGTFFNPTATTYPAQYTGNYFFVDYCSKWIERLTLSGSTATRSVFASDIAGSPVCMAAGPDGNLYLLSRTDNAVYKIVYTQSSAPVITAQPQSKTVSEGSSVSFSVTATGTAPLTYQWRKAGTAINGATNPTYTIASVVTSDAGTYSVVVRNTSGTATSNNATLTVTAPNTPPQANIATPATGATYTGGQTINFSGTGTDAEDGTLPASAFEWYVMFHHDAHTHPGPAAPSGVKSGSFSIPNSGETATNVFYRLYLVVTDARGARDTVFTDVLPRTSTITLNTSPQGLQVTLDGQPATTPLTVTSVEGMLRTVSAPATQTRNNALKYMFGSWSQGGARTQTITTPVTDASYTARYTVTLRPADAPANTVAGLNYSYYHGVWDFLPAFASLTPVSSGSLANVSLSPRIRNDSFGFRFTSYISVPTNGVYTFYTASDDGSRLLIGTDTVVKNDGAHGNRELSGKIGLQTGKHRITIDFFERRGRETLTVLYSGPGIVKRAVPAAAWFREASKAAFSPAVTNAQTDQNNIDKKWETPLKVSVYPNPAKNVFTIRISPYSGSSKARLFDATGRLVKEQLITAAQLQIVTSYLQNGLYMLLIEDKNGKAIKTIRIEK